MLLLKERIGNHKIIFFFFSEIRFRLLMTVYMMGNTSGFVDKRMSYVPFQHGEVIPIHLSSIVFYFEAHELAPDKSTRWNVARWIQFSQCFPNYYWKYVSGLLLGSWKKEFSLGKTPLIATTLLHQFVTANGDFPCLDFDYQDGFTFPQRVGGYE